MEGQEQVLLAIEVASDPLQHPEVRKRAQCVIDQVNALASGSTFEDAGDGAITQMQAESLLSLCGSLISSLPSCKAYLEKKLFGISVLQQLVKQQWADLQDEFKQRLSLFVVECCRSLCVASPPPPFALKSKLAVLFAEIARFMSTDPSNLDPSTIGQSRNEISRQTENGERSGGRHIHNLIKSFVLPEVLSWPGTRGMELACLVLRWIPEGTSGSIVEAIPAARKRILLKVLHLTLPEMVSFAYQALDKSYAAFCQGQQQQQQQSSTNKDQQAQETEGYRLVVEAALQMTLAYAEWAPISVLHQSGIINACGILMRNTRFRVAACDVLRQQSFCKLKQTLEDQKNFLSDQSNGNTSREVEILKAKSAAKALFDAFSGPCQESLSNPREYDSLGLENLEYGQILCETMVTWGRAHVKSLEGSEDLNLFLRILLAFSQHPNINLAVPTMEFWIFLTKEAFVGDTKESLSNRSLLRIPDGFMSALLDVIVTRLQKPVMDALEDYPAEYYESAKDFHEKSALLRQKLVETSRIIVKNVPEEVFRSCLGNLEKCFMLIQQNPTQKGLNIPLEAATHLLFTATGATSDAVSAQSPSLEALLPKLLNFPINMVLQTQSGIPMQFVKCLEAIGGHSHRVVPIIQYLLSMLGSNIGGTNNATNPGDMKAARQQAATVILSLASKDEAAKALCQHLTPLMEQIQRMWQQGVLRPGEKNALYEAVLVISATCGYEQQQKTLEWLWSETCQRWSNPQWQESCLSDSATFLRSVGTSGLACVANDPTFDAAASGKERLRIYHEVQLVERMSRRLLALKRKKGSDALLAVTPHLKWTVPVVARLIRCIHFLASPEGKKLLGIHCENVLELGQVERAFMLGLTPSGVSPSAFVSASSGKEVYVSSSVVMEADCIESLRVFLRGARDSSCQYLGIVTQVKVEDDNLAVRMGFKSFFDSMASASNEFAALIMENIQYQDDRCVRMMIRSFVCPLVRSCPQHCWRQWLGLILPPLLEHMHSRLIVAWHSFLTGGQSNSNTPSMMQAAQVSPSVQQRQDLMLANPPGAAAEEGEEILRETIMREITREHLSLLLIIASGDETGHEYFHQKKTSKVSPARDPTVFEWLAAECVQAASCLLATAVAALTWPDTETGQKSIKACRVALGMTQGTSTVANAHFNNALQAFVAKEMFTACMSSLTLPSHADYQSEILLVLKDIIVRHSDLVSPLLMSLPNIDEDALSSFHQAMRSKGSEKDQRNLVRKLLLRSGGGKLKALAQQHSPGSKIPRLQSSDFSARNAAFKAP
jgi:exportin-5